MKLDRRAERQKQREEYDAKVRAAQMLHERARQVRGRFLNTVAVIEHNIALLLAEYFSPIDLSKRQIFLEEIASHMSLERKRVVLTKILQRDYPRFWSENEEHFAYFKKIQEFRNKLAHSVLDTSDEALSRPLEDGIGFIQWNQGQPITERESDEWNARANMISSALNDVKTLLPYKETPWDGEPDEDV